MALIQPPSFINCFAKPALILPTFECTGSIMPNFGNTIDFARGIGAIPGQLWTMAKCMESSLAEAVVHSIDNIRNLLNSIFGDMPWSASTPLFARLRNLEVEMEYKVRAMFTEFKIYLLMKLLDIINSVLPANFLVIPIPFLSGCTIGDLLSPEGRTKIKNAIIDRIDAVIDSLGLPWSLNISGDFTFRNLEMRVQEAFQQIMIRIQEALTNFIYGIMNSLISKFQAIWNALHLPSLPNLLNFDFEGLIMGYYQQVVDSFLSLYNRIPSARELMERLQNFLLNFSLPFPSPFNLTIGQLLNLSNRKWHVEIGEFNFNRVLVLARDLVAKLPVIILEKWMELVTGFFNAIGLGALLRYIPFTFCDFLTTVAPNLGSFNIAGMVPNVSLSSLPI